MASIHSALYSDTGVNTPRPFSTIRKSAVFDINTPSQAAAANDTKKNPKNSLLATLHKCSWEASPPLKSMFE